MPPPVVLHLLGSWQNSTIEIPFPGRPDLFVKSTPQERPHIYLTQFSICAEANHDNHFPAAVTQPFPRVWHEGDVSDDTVWEPEVYRDPLTHWDLNPAPLVRRRRQVRPAKEIAERVSMQESIAANLGDTESYVSAYFYNPQVVKTITEVYSKFAKTFAEDLEKKMFSPLAAHYQHVFKNSDNFRLHVSSENQDTGLLKLTIVIPPFSELTLSDSSVFQALGFDTFAPEPEGIEIRDTGFVMHNETNRFKHFVADREIANDKISLLRSMARQANRGPPIERPGDPDLTITFKYNGPREPVNKIEHIYPPSYRVDMTKDSSKKIATATLFFNNLLKHLSEEYGFDELSLKATADQVRGSVAFKGSDRLTAPTDQLTVEFCLGQVAQQLFAPTLAAKIFTWNVGRQSPLYLPIVSKQFMQQEETRKAEARQRAVERAKVVAPAATKATTVVQTQPAATATVVQTQPAATATVTQPAARATATVTQPAATATVTQTQPAAAAVVPVQLPAAAVVPVQAPAAAAAPVQPPAAAVVPVQPPAAAEIEEEEEEEEEEVGPEEAPEVRPEGYETPPPSPPPNFVSKRRRHLVGNAEPTKRCTDLQGTLPVQYILLSEEGDKNDYVTDWGRCCIAGVGTAASPVLLNKNACYFDVKKTPCLHFTLLDSHHLIPVTMTEPTLVKIECLVFL